MKFQSQGVTTTLSSQIRAERVEKDPYVLILLRLHTTRDQKQPLDYLIIGKLCL